MDNITRAHGLKQACGVLNTTLESTMRSIWPERALLVELIAVSQASADRGRTAGPMKPNGRWLRQQHTVYLIYDI